MNSKLQLSTGDFVLPIIDYIIAFVMPK